MDRKPKARRVARKESVRDDPEQSERFIAVARVLVDEKKERLFEGSFNKIVNSKQSDNS